MQWERKLNFNHQMDQFLIPLRFSLQTKVSGVQNPILRAWCNMAARSRKVSVVFKAVGTPALLVSTDTTSCWTCSGWWLHSTFFTSFTQNPLHLDPTFAKEYFGIRGQPAGKLYHPFTKKTTEIVISSHYSHALEVLRNHSKTTSMTLQVTNKGFKRTTSNSLALLREGRSRLLLWARIFPELTHLNGLEKAASTSGASGWMQMATGMRNYIL